MVLPVKSISFIINYKQQHTANTFSSIFRRVIVIMSLVMVE